MSQVLTAPAEVGVATRTFTVFFYIWEDRHLHEADFTIQYQANLVANQYKPTLEQKQAIITELEKLTNQEFHTRPIAIRVTGDFKMLWWHQ